jgi:hypothetical protein
MGHKKNNSTPLVGLGPGGAFEHVDLLIPHPGVFADSAEAIETARAHGTKVGWYASGGGGYELDVFPEMPAIRSRLLMGAAAWK